MAKSWQSVTESDDYKSLSPEQQEEARGQYFDSVVAPQVPEDKLFDAREQFDAQTMPKPKQKEELSTFDKLIDLPLSFGQGTTNALISVAGAPTDLYNAMNRGKDWIADKTGISSLAKGAAEFIVGKELPEPFPREELPFGSKFIKEKINKVIPDYEPKTTQGKYARTIGEFSLFPGKSVVKNVLAPAVTSEFAGQATEGSGLEPYARIGGAVLGGGVANMASRPNNPAKFLAGRAGNVTQDEYALAQALMDKSRQLGTPISAAEALQHVTGGRTMLGDAQRVMEQTAKGGPKLRDFYAQRPEQNAAAARQAFGEFGNVPETASIGPNVQKAASSIVKDAETARTAATSPLYKAASVETVPSNDVSMIIRKIDDAIDSAKGGVGENSVTGKLLKDMKDKISGETHIGALQNLYKEARDRLAALPTDPNSVQRTTKGVLGPIVDDLGTVLEKNANLKAGNTLYKDISERTVTPLKQSPVGQIADEAAMPAQQKILFNENPAVGSEKEVADAVSKIAGVDDKNVNALVRQYLEGSFNEANQSLVGGMNQYGGAKYAAKIAGNQQQEKNLESAIRALPDGDAKWSKISDVLDVFRAQGRRAPVGSATEFNRMIREEMAQGTPLQEAAGVALSPSRWANIGNMFDRWRYNRVAGGAADILTNPRGAEMIGAYQPKQIGLADFYRTVPYVYAGEGK